MSRPDETKIIDRDDELAAFQRMVSLEVPHRVMVVSNRSGTGKTDLMRKLRLHCDRDYTVPVALAHLGDFRQRQDEFAVVECLHKALKSTGATLPNFEELDRARGFHNTVAFLDRLRTVSGFVDMNNAVVSGAAKVAAMMFNVEHAESVVLPEWNEETDAKARDLCVEAFVLDLIEYTNEHRAVLLFDGLDEVGEELRNWILTELLRRRALIDWENRKLIVALAGEDLAGMVYGRLPEEQHPCLEVVSGFSVWNVEQVKNFLEVNGFASPMPEEVTSIHSLLSSGSYTLTGALVVATVMFAERGAR